MEREVLIQIYQECGGQRLARLQVDADVSGMWRTKLARPHEEKERKKLVFREATW